MNLTITNDMTIKWLHEGVEYILDKLVLNQNGVDNTIYDKGSTPSHDYSQDYFTIEMLDGSNANLVLNRSSKASNLPNISLSYSINDGTWTTVTFSSSVTISNLNQGDKIRFKAVTNCWSNGSNSYHTFNRAYNSSTTYHYKVYGNILSLLYGDDFAGKSIKSNNFVFGSLFRMFNDNDNDSLVSAEDLIFPSDTYNYCYYMMFRKCTSLTNAPKNLPATTLASNCYNSMFNFCSSLVTFPNLPATTLAEYCYAYMFSGCTSLVSGPALQSTSLQAYCYQSMFNSCTSLKNAPELPATTLIHHCYTSMFYGCTSLTNAPELPATTLVNFCYATMFSGCSSLIYIKCLATNYSAAYTDGWVNGVAALGTFVKDANMSSWSTGTSGIPSGWTVQDA